MIFAQTPPSAMVLVVVVVMILVALVIFALVLLTGRIWLQAYLSGVPLSLLTLLGMRLRKTNVKAVVRALIMAKHGGVDLSWQEVERAHMTGIDLEKVVLAMIEARKRGLGITFPQLVDAEQNDRLEEKLKG